MKYIIALILLFTISCGGTRKTSISKVDIKTDSLSIENSRILKQNIVLNDIYQILPFDPLKPFIIDGKSYFNASITYDKSQFNNFQIDEGNKIIGVSKDTSEKSKDVEKSDNTILFSIIAFIVCLFIFLWFYLPKMKKSIQS
jgi:hypothetical protein